MSDFANLHLSEVLDILSIAQLKYKEDYLKSLLALETFSSHSAGVEERLMLERHREFVDKCFFKYCRVTYAIESLKK